MAVVKNQANVFEEVLISGVLIPLQLLGTRFEVHGVFYVAVVLGKLVPVNGG